MYPSTSEHFGRRFVDSSAVLINAKDESERVGKAEKKWKMIPST